MNKCFLCIKNTQPREWQHRESNSINSMAAHFQQCLSKCRKGPSRVLSWSSGFVNFSGVKDFLKKSRLPICKFQDPQNSDLPLISFFELQQEWNDFCEVFSSVPRHIAGMYRVITIIRHRSSGKHDHSRSSKLRHTLQVLLRNWEIYH